MWTTITTKGRIINLDNVAEIFCDDDGVTLRIIYNGGIVSDFKFESKERANQEYDRMLRLLLK